jgi:hypothetical protein
MNYSIDHASRASSWLHLDHAFGWDGMACWEGTSVSHFCCRDKIPEKNSLKEEQLFWPVISVPGRLPPLLLGLWQDRKAWWGNSAHLMAARKQRETQRGKSQ